MADCVIHVPTSRHAYARCQRTQSRPGRSAEESDAPQMTAMLIFGWATLDRGSLRVFARRAGRCRDQTRRAGGHARFRRRGRRARRDRGGDTYPLVGAARADGAIRCSRAMARLARSPGRGSAISPRPASMAIPAARGSTRARRSARPAHRARRGRRGVAVALGARGVPPARHLRPRSLVLDRCATGRRTASTCPARCSAASMSTTSSAA